MMYVAAQLVVLGFVILTMALVLLFIIAGIVDVTNDLRVILS